MDLFACEDVTIPAHNKVSVNIGIKLAIPIGCQGRIEASSTPIDDIDVDVATVSENFRDELRVWLHNKR